SRPMPTRCEPWPGNRSAVFIGRCLRTAPRGGEAATADLRGAMRRSAAAAVGDVIRGGGEHAAGEVGQLVDAEVLEPAVAVDVDQRGIEVDVHGRERGAYQVGAVDAVQRRQLERRVVAVATVA